jgi:hypothetical protein
MEQDITEILEVNEIWPETELTIRLILGRSTSQSPFTIWAERLSDESILISKKYFGDDVEARRSFKLLTDVLVELNDPMTSLLKETSTTDPQ